MTNDVSVRQVLSWHDPSIWRAADVGEVEDSARMLDSVAIAELETAARPHVARGTPDALASIAPESFCVPALDAPLTMVRRDLLHGRGFALLRGLPIERYSPLERAAIFLGIGALIGPPRSQNAAGHILGHVRDEGLSSADPLVRIYQTSERQTFHTDSCDVVALLCIRQGKRGGDSLLVSAGAIAKELGQAHPELLGRLLSPYAHARRGEVPTGAEPFFLLPVLSWFMGALTVFYQRQYIESAQRFANAPRLDPLGRRALDAFDALANHSSFHVRLRLRPGDVLLVNNHALLHDRTAFEDFPEPARKRHLLRLWLACTDARPLPPEFAARYGSVTVGDRGGVVVEGARPCVPIA